MKKAYQSNLYLQSITISIIVVLTTITYLNCLPNQFVYDDTSTIVENRLIKNWGNFYDLITRDYFKYSGELTYRPLVTLSYFIDYFFWHLNPMGYHVVNVVLHTLNVILMYFLVLLLFRHYDTRKPQYHFNKLPSPSQGDNTEKGKLAHKTRLHIDQISNTCLALLTCMLFAVHPLVSEVVNVISYREDLIATAFLTASFLVYLLYKERGGTQVSLCDPFPKRDSGGFSLPGPSYTSTVSLYAGAMIAYFFALLSKESAIVLPALIFFFDLLCNANAGANDRSLPCFAVYKNVLKIIRFPFFLGYVGISILYLIVRFLVFHNPQEKIVYPEGSFFVNMLTMTKVLGRYIANIFLPLSLNADYHVLYLKTPLTLSFVIPLFVLISFVIIAIRLRKKRCFYRIMILATLWFFISAIPVLNIIPLANIMADRYLYLPIFGFCLFLSTTLLHLKLSIIKYPVIVSLMMFYIFITVTRNNVWRNEFTLWYNSSQSPLCSFTTYNNLGTQYNKKGYPDTALICYQKAIQKATEVGFTHYATVYYNMGNAYEKKNLPQQAVSAYKKAIQLKPDYQQAHNNLGKVYFVLNRYDDAIAEYNTAIAIDPNFAYAYNNLGVLYNNLGRQEDAVVAYKKALALDPQYSDAYYNLGNVYEARKQYDLALEVYQIALKIDPTQVYVHNNLGTIYDKKGLLEDAIAEYKHAIRLDSAYPYSYNNLGASLIKKGDKEDALAAFQKAVDLLPDQPDFHFNIGYTLLQKGDLKNALKEFKTTLKLAPTHTEALFCSGIIYYKMGEKEKAIKSWQGVLKLNPNHEKAKKYLDDFR
ncbi:MAG: tetratricopeptide repeat protein [Candidatus Brocadia sp.]|nr:tetratricopeptide repeat protein [Candidatus Brocadia sp.]